MSNYSVLLVDDEEEVIDAIQNKIEWENLGFDVIGSAENGVKALELCEKNQPDVVITDIKMPYMDGLELSRHLKDEYPGTRVILFTGFDEFEYAKEAVHLEIEEYLLKPVNAQELTEALKRLKESLDKERAEQVNVQKLQNYYMESLPLLQTNFFISLLEGRVREQELDSYISDYQIEMTMKENVVVVFHASTHHIQENMTPLLLSISVEKGVENMMLDNWKGRAFTYLGNTVLIVGLPSSTDITRLTDECDRFCKWADRMMGATVTAGVGRPVDNLADLSASYDGAREAVSYRVLYGTKRAINIAEIAPHEEQDVSTSEHTQLTELFKAIHMGSEEMVSQSVDAVVEAIHQEAKTVNQYNLAAMEMVGSWYRFCTNNYLNFDEFTGGVKDPYKEVQQMDESMLKTWLMTVAISIREQLKNARNNSLQSIIVQAKQLVQNRFNDPDLSLDLVCSELGVSNSYFSSVFKKETGQAFIAYLTEYRMKQAAKRIVETQEKNYEIAEHVGYLDANYFSYVFKKHFGLSPSRYRAKYLGK